LLHGEPQLLAVHRVSFSLARSTWVLSRTAFSEVAIKLGVDLPLLPLVQLLEVIDLKLRGLGRFLGCGCQSLPGILDVILYTKVRLLAIDGVQRTELFKQLI